MQRFVPVGKSRLQFIQAVIHDPRAVEPVLQQLGQLRPTQVLMDRSGDEWDGWQRDPSYLDPFEKVIYDHLATSVDVAPYVVPKAVHRWCIHNGVPMGLMLRSGEPPPRKGMKSLRKRAVTSPTGHMRPEYIVGDLYQDAALQIPDVQEWLRERHQHMARALVKSYATRQERVACLFAYPEMDPVAQHVQRLARR